jgi:predicted permease
MVAASAQFWSRAVAVVRSAFRTIRRTPAHSAFVVSILAVAIAVGTVTFSVVDAVLLKPLPVPDGERLVLIPSIDTVAHTWRVTPQIFWELHDHSQTLSAVTVVSGLRGSSSTIGDLTDEFPQTHVFAEAFPMFDISAGLGRLWTTAEEARGETDVAVLGYRFWQERFGGNPNVLGMRVVTDQHSRQVIGVLSRDSEHPEISFFNAAIWLPMYLPRDSKTSGVTPTGKMRPGVTPAQVADEVAALIPGGWKPAVAPYLEFLSSSVRGWMLLALGASGLVVLLGCVNAANLMLSRSHHRAREMALRASLGASRRRIAAEMVAEGVMLSLGAAVAALVFGLWAISAARAGIISLQLGVTRAAAISLNSRVLIAALISALVTGILFSCVPAWQGSRTSIVSLLKDGSPTMSGGRSRWRQVFVVGEIATVAVLLVMSWLFVTSLIRVVNVDLGVDRGHLIGLMPRVPFRASVLTVAEQLRGVPGVVDAAVSQGAWMPLLGTTFGGAEHIAVVDAVGVDGAPFEATAYKVTPNFFAVAGIPFVRGQVWQAGDVTSVVLDDEAASRLFGELNVVGRQIRTREPARVYAVAGVVSRVRGRGPERTTPPGVYFTTSGQGFGSVLVRTQGPAGQMLPAVTDAMKPYAPNQKDEYIHTGDEAIRRMTLQRRFNAWMMSAFGCVGMLIGAAGIYAVTTSVVSQQTGEIGVRMVLGASPGRIARDVLIDALRNLCLGLAIGLPVAWWFSRGFGALLFQVTPADLSVYVGVSALLAGVGFFAAIVPARRASRVDPIRSLRG